jgi:hypothetical protein
MGRCSVRDDPDGASRARPVTRCPEPGTFGIWTKFTDNPEAVILPPENGTYIEQT